MSKHTPVKKDVIRAKHYTYRGQACDFYTDAYRGIRPGRLDT